jgi:cytochrome c oxidase accessory protein FixG
MSQTSGTNEPTHGATVPVGEPTSADLPLLDAPEHVLSTLEGDGSRRWLYPRLSTGKWWRRRRTLAYFLIVFFVLLPHLRFGGKPIVLLNIIERKFIFFGHTFLPSDTMLLALLMLGVFVSIVMATAFAGRVWCGWGCPQTIYMEYLFRPIDRLFQGTAGKGGKPKQPLSGGKNALRFLVYLVLCMALAHTFLAYFVGTESLARWIHSSPLEHPTAFIVMGATTFLMLFDFLFFREQLCLIACPYGRFQSVMLDRQSLIVAYDENRGEPRKKGRHEEGDGAGDCVDCNQCVVVCPTGIDIRKGLQLECVNCTQCIDACDNVMDRVGRPRGLIRYSSQDALAGKPPKLLRWRTVAYPALPVIIAAGFLAVLSTKYAFDAKLLRGRGNPFNAIPGGIITNNFRLRLVNRTDEERTYQLKVIEPSGAVTSDDTGAAIVMAGNQETLYDVVIEAPVTKLTPGGASDLKIQITDDIGNERTVTNKMLGPQ